MGQDWPWDGALGRRGRQGTAYSGSLVHFYQHRNGHALFEVQYNVHCFGSRLNKTELDPGKKNRSPPQENVQIFEISYHNNCVLLYLTITCILNVTDNDNGNDNDNDNDNVGWVRRGRCWSLLYFNNCCQVTKKQGHTAHNMLYLKGKIKLKIQKKTNIWRMHPIKNRMIKSK